MASLTAVTVGNFDGVHIGHAALVAAARAEADRGGTKGRVVALVFDPHPLAMLRPDLQPARLSEFEQRAKLLKELGVDEAVRLEPTTEFLTLAPEAFVEWLVERWKPDQVVEGPDFCFGHNRAGDVRTLAGLGRAHGFQTCVIEPVLSRLSDELQAPASSTLVRTLVREGRVPDVCAVLGRPYEIVGPVERGDQRGREIGFPTANIDTRQLLPRDGVYAGDATLPDGRIVSAAISVGDKPTFNGTRRIIEAHLLDFDGPLDHYGWTIHVRLNQWLRDQAKYSRIGALLEQMKRDVERTRWFAAEKTSVKANMQRKVEEITS